jgi:hypothetical protein
VLAGQAAIVLAIGFRDGIHKAVANAEIREAHGRDDGNQHHPDAVALRAEIAISERNGDKRCEQANGLGNTSGHGGEGSATKPLLGAPSFSCCFERTQAKER